MQGQMYLVCNPKGYFRQHIYYYIWTCEKHHKRHKPFSSLSPYSYIDCCVVLTDCA